MTSSQPNTPPKPSPAYLRAKELLPTHLHATFDELLQDYKFAAIKHHGQGFVSAVVIAELVLAGWRCSSPPSDPAESAS